MSSEPLVLRTIKAIQGSLIAAELPGFNYPGPEDGPVDNEGLPMVVAGVPTVPGLIIWRRNPDTTDLKSPSIVLSPSRSTYVRSPAGMVSRVINVLVTIFYRSDNTDTAEKAETHDPTTQFLVAETIAAMFHLNPQMPTELTARVPEAEECRVVPAENFIPAAYRNQTDVHRMVIGVQTCQLAGVA
jgi:hypothetical protein